MGKQYKTIAVDFDGVLCKNEYPKIGEPDNKLISELIERQKNGDKLILWTCRRGIYLAQAVKWCKNKGLTFDAVNKNLPEYVEKFGGDTRKVFADEYIDDKFDYIAHLSKDTILDEEMDESELDDIDKEFKKLGFIRVKAKDTSSVYYEKYCENHDYIHCIDIYSIRRRPKVMSYQKDNKNRIFTCAVSLSAELINLVNAKINKLHKKRGLDSWAEHEIELVKMKPEEEDAEYFNMCCESALKAYESLRDDYHSGFSIDITKQILNDLIDRKPLSPIKDTCLTWNKLDFSISNDIKYECQCKRMSSLFKLVHVDGTVTYHDNDRVVCVDINNPDIRYTNGLVHNIIDTIYPISLPYTPDKPFEVYVEEFLVDKNNGDFDTKGVFYVIKPDGKKVKINRFFKEDSSTHEWKEIGKIEYLFRKLRSDNS